MGSYFESRFRLNSLPGEPRYVLPIGHDSEDSEDESYHASDESESQERLPSSSASSNYESAASNSSGEEFIDNHVKCFKIFKT